MKKAIAILLVVLVAGVMFGVDSGTPAKLEIEASVAGRFYHGFTAAQITTIPGTNAIRTLGSLLESSVDLDLEEETVGVNIGYYNLLSTGNAGLTVSFNVAPLVDAETPAYYVPYKVTFGSLNGTGVIGTGNAGFDNGIDLGISAGPNTNEITAVDADVLTTTAAGRKWTSVPVLVTFDEAKNIDFALPEGTYTATITATISTN